MTYRTERTLGPLSVFVDTNVFYAPFSFSYVGGTVSAIPVNLKKSMADLQSYAQYLSRLEAVVAHPRTLLVPAIAEEVGWMADNFHGITLRYGSVAVKRYVDTIDAHFKTILSHRREVVMPESGAVKIRHPRTIAAFAGRTRSEIIGSQPIIGEKRYSRADATLLADALVQSATGPVVIFSLDTDILEMFRMNLTLRHREGLLSPLSRVQVITSRPGFTDWDTAYKLLEQKYSFDSRNRCDA